MVVKRAGGSKFGEVRDVECAGYVRERGLVAYRVRNVLGAEYRT